MERTAYIGDGLYASFDGEQFSLRAPRENGDHIVYLDASVLAAFDEFRAGIMREISKRKQAAR